MNELNNRVLLAKQNNKYVSYRSVLYNYEEDIFHSCTYIYINRWFPSYNTVYFDNYGKYALTSKS